MGSVITVDEYREAEAGDREAGESLINFFALSLIKLNLIFFIIKCEKNTWIL